MARNRRGPIKNLKIKLLEYRIDKDLGKIRTVRKAIEVSINDLHIPISNWNMYCKSNEVVYQEPYYGLCVDDVLVHRYALDMGYIKKDVSFDEFSSNRLKSKTSPKKLTKLVGNYYNWDVEPNTMPIEVILKTLYALYGMEDVKKTYKEMYKKYILENSGKDKDFKSYGYVEDELNDEYFDKLSKMTEVQSGDD